MSEPERPPAPAAALLVILAGLLMVAGSLLPWVGLRSVSGFIHLASRLRGVDVWAGVAVLAAGVGVLVAGLAVALAAGAEDRGALRWGMGSVAAVGGAVGAALALWIVASPRAPVEGFLRRVFGPVVEAAGRTLSMATLHRLERTFGISWGTRPGVYLALAGALLGLAAGVMVLIARRSSVDGRVEPTSTPTLEGDTAGDT